MRAFSVVCLTLSALAVHAGHLSGGAGFSSGYVPTSSYSSNGGGYAPAVAAAPVAVAAPIAVAPPIAAAAPVVAAAPIAAAPAVYPLAPPIVRSTPQISSPLALVPAPPAPASVGAPQVIAAGPSAPRVHEIHSHSAGRQIRIEEYRGPRQLIRVFEGGHAAPEVFRVQAPAQQSSVIRLVTRGEQNRVQHLVHQNPNVQVINVQKQPAPGPRVIHIVRGPALPPRVEVAHAAPEAPAQIVLQPSAEAQTHVVGPSRPADAAAVGASIFASSPVTIPAAPIAAPALPVAVDTPVVSAPVAVAAPISSGLAPVQQVHTNVVHHDGGYSQGGHVKIIKKLH